MNVIQKNVIFKKKKENGKKKYNQGNRGWRGCPANVQDCSTKNKAIFLSIHKQFWQFPDRQHCINCFYHRKGKWQCWYSTQKKWYLARTIACFYSSAQKKNILEVLLVHGKQSNIEAALKDKFLDRTPPPPPGKNTWIAEKSKNWTLKFLAQCINKT